MTSFLAQHYGNIESVVGLIIAIVGFRLTIRDVRRAERAAEEAREAARQAVAEARARMTTDDIMTVLQVLRELESDGSARRWSRVRYRASDAKHRLLALLGGAGPSDSERSEIGDLSEILSKVGDLPEGQEPTRQLGRLMKRVADFQQNPAQIRGRILSRSMEP